MATVQTDRGEGLTGEVGWKAPVVVATTANIVLSGVQTIDDILLVAETTTAGDRVLVKDQTDASENGIYIVQSSAWTRAPDWDGAKDILQGTVIFVASGTANAGVAYYITTANPITIGTTNVAFAVTVTVSTSAFMATLLDDATAADARTTLGLGDMALQNKASVNIDGGTIDGITDIAVADGGTGASTHTANSVLIGEGTSAISSVAPGTSGNVLTSDGTNWASTAVASIPRGYIAGCILAPDDTTTLEIGAGQVSNVDNDLLFNIAALGKTNGAWAVGDAAGGLDTGSIASSTWYHVWAIYRSDTGVTDYLLSLSASSPTMPTNYGEKRRIGSVKTNGSDQFVSFIQRGDKFIWNVAVESTTTTSTTSTLRTLDVPDGIIVDAMINVYSQFDGAGSHNIAHWDPAAGTTPPSVYNGRKYTTGGLVSTVGYSGEYVITTNASQQIYNDSTHGTVTAYSLVTVGWIDRRGQDG